jgi:glycosyltransferase involved in cell wall biosynthesis
MKISIVTVVYNSVEYLESTIHSIIEQNNPNIEYIVVDGASSDGTLEIISRYERHIARWISEPDTGIYNAMNKGWALASPDSFILFLGAGDKIVKLPDQHELLDRDVVVYGTVYIGDRVFKSGVNRKIKRCNTIHHQALLVHKSISHHPPFNESYRVYGDYDFNARLYKRGVQFRYSSNFTAYALPDGISANPNLEEIVKIVGKHFGFYQMILCFIFTKLSLIKRQILSFST